MNRHTDAPPKSFLSAGLSFDGLMGVVILLGLSASWLGLLGSWHWALDLLAHFRWQYLLTGLVAVVWTCWRRQWLVLAASLATVILNLALIGRLAWAPGVSQAQVGAGFQLRVVSANVLTGNRQRQALVDFLKGAEADVVFLMEVDAAWIRLLETALEGRYPHRLLAPRQDNFGAALFSRLPLLDAKLLRDVDLGILEGDGAQVPSIEARLDHQGRQLVILGTHPVPPVGPRNSALRDGQLAALGAYVRRFGEMNPAVPVLLVGDLNANPWSHGMRLLCGAGAGEGGGALAFRSLTPPWLPTWRVPSPLMIPIDHALCTPPLIVVKHGIGPDVGSDHRPLVLELGWTAASSP